MASPTSMAEWFLMLPLRALWSVTGMPDSAGPTVLVGFLAIVGLWIGIFIRWKRDDRPSRLVGFFLVTIVGFPAVEFLIMGQAFGHSLKLPIVNQFLIVAQSYFSLSVLVHCEAYWKHRGRAAYVTATLTTAMALLVWMITGFCYALTLQ